MLRGDKTIFKKKKLKRKNNQTKTNKSGITLNVSNLHQTSNMLESK